MWQATCDSVCRRRFSPGDNRAGLAEAARFGADCLIGALIAHDRSSRLGAGITSMPTNSILHSLSKSGPVTLGAPVRHKKFRQQYAKRSNPGPASTELVTTFRTRSKWTRPQIKEDEKPHVPNPQANRCVRRCHG